MLGAEAGPACTARGTIHPTPLTQPRRVRPRRPSVPPRSPAPRPRGRLPSEPVPAAPVAPLSAAPRPALRAAPLSAPSRAPPSGQPAFREGASAGALIASAPQPPAWFLTDCCSLSAVPPEFHLSEFSSLPRAPRTPEDTLQSIYLCGERGSGCQGNAAVPVENRRRKEKWTFLPSFGHHCVTCPISITDFIPLGSDPQPTTKWRLA